MGAFAEQNATALMSSMQGRIYLPVNNFGDSPQEVAVALRQIGQGYARIGRKNDAETFMQKAEEVLD